MATIPASITYDAAIDVAMVRVLTELGARPKADTEAMFAKVKDDWWTHVGATGMDVGLLRRNFDGTPWFAPMPFDAPANFSWLDPGNYVPQYNSFSYAIRLPVDGVSGVQLGDMQSATDTIRTAFTAAHPGMDQP
jgi:hypothetical protein